MEVTEKAEAELKELKDTLVRGQRGRWTALRTRYWEFDFKQAVEAAFLRGYALAKLEQGK